MTTRDLGISLHDELDRREKLIAQLNLECEAIRTTLGILERPSLEALNRVTKVVSRRNTPPTTKTGSTGKALQCEKHPEARPNRKGECKSCAQAAYQKKWYAKKQQQATETPVETKPPDRKPNGGSMIVRCDECGDRFQNVRDMGIHKSRVHFGSSSAHGSTLNGAI